MSPWPSASVRGPHKHPGISKLGYEAMQGWLLSMQVASPPGSITDLQLTQAPITPPLLQCCNNKAVTAQAKAANDAIYYGNNTSPSPQEEPAMSSPSPAPAASPPPAGGPGESPSAEEPAVSSPSPAPAASAPPSAGPGESPSPAEPAMSSPSPAPASPPPAAVPGESPSPEEPTMSSPYTTTT